MLYRRCRSRRVHYALRVSGRLCPTIQSSLDGRAFVDQLDLASLSFERVQPAATGQPAYHPSELLKRYVYGYLNRIQSSRRLERRAQRNAKLPFPILTSLVWLLSRTSAVKNLGEFGLGRVRVLNNAMVAAAPEHTAKILAIRL